MNVKKYLEYYQDYIINKNTKKLENIIEYNTDLIENYPFLALRDYNTDEIINDGLSTWLDNMPEGWRIAFSMKMCDEIKKALIEYDSKNGTDLLHEYRIVQIKEKFGGLRWYDNGNIPEVALIISKYEKLSEHTCIICGEQAIYSTKNWISPYCESCTSTIYYNYNHPKNVHLNGRKPKYKFESLFKSLEEDKSILDD